MLALKLDQKAASAMVYSTIALLVSSVIFASFVNTDTPLVVISGSSMTPALNPGDAVLVYQPHISELNVNDIIAFKGRDANSKAASIVVHRVIDKHVASNIHLVTKGDFNLQNDDNPVTENNYVGKVYLTIPKLGVFLNVIKNPVVIASMVIIFAIYVAYFRIRPVPNVHLGEKQA